MRVRAGPMSISTGMPMIHRIDKASPQAKERYTGKPIPRVYGVNGTTITRRKVDREERTSESPTAPARGTALKLPSPLSMISLT